MHTQPESKPRSSWVTPLLLVPLLFAQFIVFEAWFLDELSSARVFNNVPQYAALGGVLIALLGLGSRLRSVVVIGLVFAGAHGARWATGLYQGERIASDDGLTVLVANVYTGNTDASPLLALIEAEQPDVVGLLEVDARWIDDLAPLRRSYPHHLEMPREDNFGIAVYAREPVGGMAVEELPGGSVPSLYMVTADRFKVFVAHPLPPIHSSYRARRDAILAELARVVGRERTVVMGDLNITPWSPAFPVPGAPVAGGTWPSGLPAPMRLPIDHVLVSPDLGLSRLEVGPHIGSDHRPVLATISER